MGRAGGEEEEERVQREGGERGRKGVNSGVTTKQD